MSRDHRIFAGELRTDAAALRQMAESLERRAAEHDHLADAEAIEREQALDLPPATVLNMDEAQHQAWMRRIRLADARRPAIDEDNCAFGLRFIGSCHAPTLDYT